MACEGDSNLKDEIEKMRKTIREKDEIIRNLKKETKENLTNEEINRYSRQILLPNIGVAGQKALKNASVLIVGAGGLGCPSSLYLAGSGIGHIGIVDYDTIELNNIHRQLLHSEGSIGKAKVDSAANALKSINSSIKVTTFNVLLNSSNALDIISNFDVILDATDNVPTRYLINDACVLLSKPLVSGSALKMEGQLTVYNYENGPCYRCIFPVPPPAEAVTNCGDGGVLNVIPGVIGVLQALETIKIILKQNVLKGHMLLFDGSESTFRRVKLRLKNDDCTVCGKNPTIKALVDYEQFCGSKTHDKNPNLKLLPPEKRLSTVEYNKIKDKPHVLVDVRSKEEFSICSLDNSVNIPMNTLPKKAETILELVKHTEEKESSKVPVYVVCRRGNDSQKAVIFLEEALGLKDREIKDLVGGLHAWARDIEPSFPVY